MSVAKQNNGIHDHAYKLPKFAKPGNWTLIAAYGKNVSDVEIIDSNAGIKYCC